MHIESIFRYVFDHPHQSIGVLCALIILTMIGLLLRYVKESQGSDHSDEINLEAIEDAFKKVLAETKVNVSADSMASAGALSSSDVTSVEGAVGSAGAGTATGGASDAALSERDRKIAVLQSELEKARTAAASAKPAPGEELDAIKTLEYESKIQELEARLGEYSIIEDDIADLSMFKEENAKLRDEVRVLKSQMGDPNSAPSAAPIAPAPAVNVVAEAPQAAAASVAVPDFQAADKLGLDSNDDVMKEFAAAVEGTADTTPHAARNADLAAGVAALVQEPVAVQPPELKVVPPVAPTEEDPLNAMPDADKIMTEIAQIPLTTEAQGESVLNETLDTDKLLQEVDALGGPQTDVPVHDDLMSEFKDAAKGNG